MGEGRPNVSHVAGPDIVGPALAMGADFFFPYNTGLVQNVEEGLSVASHDRMGKLAQTFSPDDSLHLDILFLWLMSVSPGGVMASLNNTGPVSFPQEHPSS